jgi:hypothetical protein
MALAVAAAEVLVMDTAMDIAVGVAVNENIHGLPSFIRMQ